MKRHRTTVVTPELSPKNDQRGCNGKRCHEDFHVAEKMARRTRRQTEGRVMAYKCKTCHAYHVGDAGEYLNKKRQSRRRLQSATDQESTT